MENIAATGVREARVLNEDWPEYRLVVPADEPVSRQVRHLRMEWENTYGKNGAADWFCTKRKQ